MGSIMICNVHEMKLERWTKGRWYT